MVNGSETFDSERSDQINTECACWNEFGNYKILA
jgi:hypothetical protein